MSNYNEAFMLRAIELARLGMRSDSGGPFGSVVVLDGKVVGEGNNQVTSTNDPTAHAEVVAIRDACKNLNTFELAGAEIYASCEPCPMCLAAIYWSRAAVIYIANDRHQAADAGFDDAFIYDEISLPTDKRSILIEHHASEEALSVFREWTTKTDKIEY